MKKRFSFVLVLLLALCAVVLVGCKKDKEPQETTGNGYGIVYSDYVGHASLKVKEGLVTEAKINEYFLPSHWANVTGDVDASLVVEIQGKWGAVKYAKYVKVADKTFTANAEGIYSAEGIADLKAWIASSEANAKWYVEALAAGNAKAVDANGTELTAAYNAKSQGFSKESHTNYWTSEKSGLGWAANMRAIEAALVGTKVDAADDAIVKGSDGKWSFGTVASGATLVAAKDYYAVAKLAYANATK